MKLLKKALLYDISNMAYLVADTGDTSHHSLHQVRDICQEGNIDRVSRILGLAYAHILSVLSPLIDTVRIDENKDFSKEPQNYVINFRKDGDYRFLLSSETKLHIKETAHEYMVCMVMADWLGVTYPEAADVWKFRFEKALKDLEDIAASLKGSSCRAFGRRIQPI